MRVALRPIVSADLDHIFGWQRDPASVAMAGVPSRERAAFDAHWANMLREPTIVARMILADDTPVGWAQSKRGDDGRRHVGYWLARDAWGRGIASRALPLLVAQLRERPLHATVRADNAASRRVLERAGFRHVGEESAGVLGYELE